MEIASTAATPITAADTRRDRLSAAYDAGCRLMADHVLDDLIVSLEADYPDTSEIRAALRGAADTLEAAADRALAF